MKISYVIAFSLPVLIGVGACKNKKSNTADVAAVTTVSAATEPVQIPIDEPLVVSYEPNALSVEFEDMDPAVDPKVDFYSYANGTWVKNNPVPPTENRWSNFNILSENNNKKLRGILEKAAAQKAEKGSVAQLIGDYYFTFMDSVKRDREGINPIKSELQKIDALRSKKELGKLFATQHNYGVKSLFSADVDQDLKDNTLNILYFGQAGILLPNKDYYVKTDSASVAVREAYVAHLGRMFAFLGYDEKRAGKSAEAILSFETKLAEASMGPVELRNIEAQYNKMTLKEFTAGVSYFDWDGYFLFRGLKNIEELVVSQPLFFQQMEKLLREVSLDTWKDYLKIQLLEASATKLSTAIENENFAFFSTTLRGTKKMKQPWERAITAISWSGIGEVLGRAFVEEYFKPEAKQKVNEMVDNIMEVFRERLDGLEWMSAPTKEKALEKLASFTRKLGYPDKWTDFSSVTISRESYFKNWQEASRFAVSKNIAKLGKPIDRSEWHMAPHIVNAYYNPLWNEIVFPAGIMQPPFFDPSKEDAVNYARMGAVIGHEFLHGFDDQGAQFDATGTFLNWWTEEDQQKFAARTQKLVAHFNSFEALPGVFVNGELTLGENIADVGGLTMAYYAYQRSLLGKERTKINNFTPEQRFFIAFAQVWKENHTDNSMKLQVFTNPHAPGKYRVLGPLANMPEFFSAFQVKEGDPMRRSPETISLIW